MKHKYQIVSASIEHKINTDLYKDKLPTEDELIVEYGVSRNTIRKAIQILVQKGIIIPIQGSGLFIRKISVDGAINLETFRGLTQDFLKSEIISKLIEFEETISDDKISNAMKCPVGTPIYFVKRLRIVDGINWVIEYSYFNRNHIPYLNQEIIEGSIYDYIQHGLKKQIGYVDRVIQADFLKKEDAKILGLQENDPALLSINKSMLKTGEIFDYSIDVHNYKHTKFLKLSNFAY